MSKYMTRQRKLLLAYLGEHAHELLSAREIAEALKDSGVSLSAVYRNMAELEAEGALQRGSRGGAREACYRYVGAASCRGELHLSCKKCGRTFHMGTGEADRLVDSVDRVQGFLIDKSDTVLRGLCDSCRRK